MTAQFGNCHRFARPKNNPGFCSARSRHGLCESPLPELPRDATKTAKATDFRFVLRGLRGFAVIHIAAGQDAGFRK
jgi:hypothetical protein